MIAVMMDSPEIKRAVIETDMALQENRRALRELLECLGVTATPRISLFIEKAGDDGQMDTRRV